MKIIKLFILIIFTLFICLTVIPTALADDAVNIDIGSVSTDGTGYTYLDNKVTIHANGTYHITGTTTTNSIRVYSGVTADITLNNVSIDVGGTNTSAFDMKGATINLTLVGNNSLTSGGYSAGFEAPESSVLTIFGETTTTLTAQGGSRGAGIGGGANYAGGSITINGGNITATGGSDGAGIGGGSDRAGGTITINGGEITATGGQNGAGIGGGYLSSGGTTIISGGTVRATGGTDGAGIGGGHNTYKDDDYAHGGTITITGGNVTAAGNGRSAGIGGGRLGSSGTITISGGNVNATSGNTEGPAGIGGGNARGVTKITISDGTVSATAQAYGAGIGGASSQSGGIIEISGGAVTARSYRGAGIGGGERGEGGSITISGGTVDASSGLGGAGIGGGYYASGGTIDIQGGDITSSGGMWGAGIGSGGDHDAGNITISGGDVNANGGNYAAGIGAGGTSTPNSHTGGTIRILGGKVTAKGGGSDMDAGLDIGRGRNGVNGTLLIDGAAQVNLGANGVDPSVTTLETCLLHGTAAGSLLGAYEDGMEIGGTLIDVGNGELENGTGYTVIGNTVTLSRSGYSYVLFGSTTSRNIVVQSGTSVDVTLFAADIQPVSGCAFNITAATVNMGLVGDNTLSSGVGFAGLQAARFSSLTINGSGSLTSTGGTGGAGIGGGSDSPAGNITFLDVIVEAVGSGGGAGIGGGSGGAGGAVRADGENTTVSATGGGNGYDIGSGSNNSSGGSLTVQNNATVMMNRNGTNANASFTTGSVGGDGAGLLAGTYLNSQKLLTCRGVTAAPTSDAKAFDDVTLTANVTGLSNVNPQGQIAFFDNGSKIGQASLTRTVDGSADAKADLIWSSRGGSHTITAQYVQNETLDSYYMTNDGELGGYLVAKIEQASLSISGIPDTVTYGDASFMLSVNGGSGTGTGLGYSVTSGDAVSVNISGVVTVEKAGQSTITITKAGDDNYLPVSADVTITVNKAIPPTVVFPSASTITYEQQLSDSTLTGGSGDGTFAWENPSTVPPVINTGYNVIFTPNDTDNYDYTGVELTKNVSITVNKATPVVTFPTADEITYEQRLSDSELTGGSGDGSFAWESPSTIPTVVNSGYRVIFTPDDKDNYLTTSQIVDITVQKAQQAAISVGGIPGTVTYGDSSFDLSGNGGSGTGAFSYSVASGDAVSVSTSGTVTVLKAGTAQITATKAGDSNYLPVFVDVTITVNKAIPPTVVFPSATELTYGQPLSDSALTGGSAEGTFAWEHPDTIPTVINSGYNVEFTPSDTDNYDYTGVELTKNVSIIVIKATPVVTFPTADEITYEQPLSASELTGGSGDGSFEWENPTTIPTVVNSGYRVVFTPDDMDNYLTVSEIVAITVQKAQQATLNVGMPSAVTYGDLPFDLSGCGGSGIGTFSYSVASGDAVSVSTSGTVTVHKAGSVQITVTKAGDDNYLPVSADVTIIVDKAIPLVVFPTASSLTYGQPLSDSALTGGSGAGSFAWESADTIPTVINSGYSVVFTPSDTDNYLVIKQPVAIAVRKAAQAPLSVSGIPDTLTLGDKSFELRVSGGSGTGSLSYAVISGNAVIVDALGKVTINHGGTAAIKVTNPGDDNYLPVSRTVSLTVNKAEQTGVLSFALLETIVYGDTPFQIIGSGGNGSGAFSYQVASGNAVAVSTTGAVTVLRPGEAVITAVKAGDSDYLSQEKTIQISVGKGTQSALVVTGVPSRINSGSAPFGLIVNGGSGSGIVSYAVTSGRAVSVDTDGTVTILRPGKAELTVTKAEDDYYLATTATVEINVSKATSPEDISATSEESPTPSAAPSSTVTPSPTATNAVPSPSGSPALLKPAFIQAGESTDKLIVTINIGDLPEGTASIKLASGKIIQIDTTQSTLDLPISQDDLNEDGELVIVALDAENIPLGNYGIALTDGVWQQGITENGANSFSVFLWIAAGVLVVGIAIAIFVMQKKRK